ncbi:hypothetical protein TNCV_2244781 [Trichonephila clavipes]|nr:hypothetical protein TNCV_2244781 [Trichonephila clavipes]
MFIFSALQTKLTPQRSLWLHSVFKEMVKATRVNNKIEERGKLGVRWTLLIFSYTWVFVRGNGVKRKGRWRLSTSVVLGPPLRHSVQLEGCPVLQEIRLLEGVSFAKGRLGALETSVERHEPPAENERLRSHQDEKSCFQKKWTVQILHLS